jgi:hypothetical protein
MVPRDFNEPSGIITSAPAACHRLRALVEYAKIQDTPGTMDEINRIAKNVLL